MYPNKEEILLTDAIFFLLFLCVVFTHKYVVHIISFLCVVPRAIFTLRSGMSTDVIVQVLLDDHSVEILLVQLPCNSEDSFSPLKSYSSGSYTLSTSSKIFPKL